MEEFILILFFIIVLVNSLCKNRSYIIGLFMFFGLCLLLPFVFDVAYDHVWGYIPNFEFASKNQVTFSNLDGIEYGFMQLLSLGSLFFSEYSYFMMFIYFFIYYKWSNIFYKYDINTVFLVCLYLFYPFVLDAIQTRNFIAAFFVLLGMFNLTTNTPRSKFFFFLYICLASSIHTTALLYLPFIFINISSEDNIKRLRFFAMMCIVASIILYFNYDFLQIFSYLFEGRYTYYFEQQKFGFLIPTVQILAGYFLAGYVYKLEKKLSNKTIAEIYLGTDLQAKYVVLVYCISLISFFFIILCLININFERMFRNLLILYYGLIWISFKRYRGSAKLIMILILSLMFFIGGNGLEYYRYSESEEMLITMLSIIAGILDLF